MNKLIENQTSGEIWMRTPSGKILPSTDALSALNLKYSTIDSNFHFELINNEIKRFDFFYDVIFIETASGYIFDKLSKSENILIPENNDNRLTTTENGNKFPDYWLDEVNKKIYVVDNEIKYWTSVSVKINVKIKQFDITKNLYSTKFSYDINLTYCNFSNLTKKPILEPCKISYNNDTRCFNVSFILRGNNDEFGLISTILKKDQNLVIDNINCLLPYTTLQEITSDVIIDKLLETDFYS
jgi:hypothetical protein